MNTMLTLLALLLPAAATASDTAPKKAPRPTLDVNVPPWQLEMKDFTFPSGLRVIMQPDHSQPIVAVRDETRSPRAQMDAAPRANPNPGFSQIKPKIQPRLQPRFETGRARFLPSRNPAAVLDLGG